MPADIVPALDCAANFGVFEVPSSTPGKTYTVTFNGSEGPAHCTCDAYKFSKGDKHCKHIDQVFRGACMYNCQWNDGNSNPEFRPVEYIYHGIVEDERCPVCGGPTAAVRRAV